MPNIEAEVPQCPYCRGHLPVKPIRQQACPNCGKMIVIMGEELITEEDAFIADWLIYLSIFGLGEKHFKKARKKLTEKFGEKASAHETVWHILNHLLIEQELTIDDYLLEDIYNAMSRLMCSAREDPFRYLVQAEETRLKRVFEKPLLSGKMIFLGYYELEYIGWLRGEGRLNEADQLLFKAEPSPAVLAEVRKNASARAAIAKKEGNWQGVIEHLESYTKYANQWREYCLKHAKYDPHPHTTTDQKLLAKAKELVNQNNPKP